MLLLHGGLGLDHTYLRPWLDPLAEHAELCFVDLLGNGRSSEPADWSKVDHDTWTDGVDRLRDHLGWQAPILFGHSYGAFLALEYALRFPDHVGGLILCSTSAAFDHAAEALERAHPRDPERVDAFRVALSRPLSSDEEWRRVWEVVTPLYFAAPTPDMLAAVRGGRMRAAATNRSVLGCVATYDVRARLGEIRVPTLILVGAHDFITPPDPCADTLRQIPGSEHVVFEHSGHFPFMEERGRFLAVVSQWLTRQEHR